MKVAITINLGNYENIRIETNEYPDFEQCLAELNGVLRDATFERAERFRVTYIEPWLVELMAKKGLQEISKKAQTLQG